MSVFAISDPHLSLVADKPMDLFGDSWENHTERLKENWLSLVTERDTVVIGGDISWGLTLEEAKPDLDFLHALPGRKILFKGNHDLWWTGIHRLNLLYDDITFVQYNAVRTEDLILAGTRGWTVPGNSDWTLHDEKMYVREVGRLRMSLEDAKNLRLRIMTDEMNLDSENPENDAVLPIVVQMHYPPFNDAGKETNFTPLFHEYGVKTVLYGHLHGRAVHARAVRGERDGIQYYLVSCDYLDCIPKKIR